MDYKKLQKIINTNELCVIRSTRTMQPFIRNNAIHLFSEKDLAQKYSEDHPDTNVDGPKIFDYKQLNTFCLSNHIHQIEFTVGEATRECIRLPPDKYYSVLRYYNPPLNRLCLLIKQDKRKKDLYRLQDEDLIIPIILENSEGIPKAFFCHSQNPEKSISLGVAFTDVPNYQTWAGENNVENIYSPLTVSFSGLCDISGVNGFIINPAGMYLIITNEMIEKIQKHPIKSRKKQDDKNSSPVHINSMVAKYKKADQEEA